MLFEPTTHPDSRVFLRSESIKFNQHAETFHDIFQRTLNYKSSSRPPKIELTGILIPLQNTQLQPCSFKLETDQSEFHLRMNETNCMLAKKMEWEEVTVKGYLDPDEGLFDVEKISLSNRSEPDRISIGPTDLYFELDQYKNSIARRGVLDVAPDYLAS